MEDLIAILKNNTMALPLIIQFIENQSTLVNLDKILTKTTATIYKIKNHETTIDLALALIILQHNPEAIELLLDTIYAQSNHSNIQQLLKNVVTNLNSIYTEQEIPQVEKNQLQLLILTAFTEELKIEQQYQHPYLAANSKFLAQNYLPLTSNKLSNCSSNLGTTKIPPQITSIFNINTTNPHSVLIHQLAFNIHAFRATKKIVLTSKYNLPDQQQAITCEESSNAAMFKIPLGYNYPTVILEECWCHQLLSRDHLLNIRDKIENGIIDTILATTTNLHAPIRIINLGSDRIGLLHILARLNIHGFIKIQTINIEVPYKKNITNYLDREKKFENILKLLFGDLYTYETILNENGNLIQTINKLPNHDLTVIFAEDLGGVTFTNYQDRYNKAISEVIKQVQLKLSSPGTILYSKYNGEIKTLTSKREFSYIKPSL